MTKIDYKKDFKQLYLPKAAPTLIDVTPMTFIMADGTGDPNTGEYFSTVSAMYSVAYTIKMKFKDFDGYCDYTVFPLEGLWWSDGAFDLNKRDNWLWTSMIRQPDFVTPELFAKAVSAAQAKKPDIDFSKVRLQTFCEGLCVQMLHVGPYATEPATVGIMQKYMKHSNLHDMTGAERKHHEIYLSDPNKSVPDKLKTVLRHPVEYNN